MLLYFDYIFCYIICLHYIYIILCVYVCVRARARACACNFKRDIYIDFPLCTEHWHWQRKYSFCIKNNVENIQ